MGRAGAGAGAGGSATTAEARLRARREMAEARAREDPSVRLSHPRVGLSESLSRVRPPAASSRGRFACVCCVQNAFWRGIECPMGHGPQVGGSGTDDDGAPLRPLTTFADSEHRAHIIVRRPSCLEDAAAPASPTSSAPSDNTRGAALCARSAKDQGRLLAAGHRFRGALGRQRGRAGRAQHGGSVRHARPLHTHTPHALRRHLSCATLARWLAMLGRQIEFKRAALVLAPPATYLRYRSAACVYPGRNSSGIS